VQVSSVADWRGGKAWQGVFVGAVEAMCKVQAWERKEVKKRRVGARVRKIKGGIPWKFVIGSLSTGESGQGG